MNYERIYSEFIADRRSREAGLAGYTERHHILPRSLGGTDDAENLITLTAEDHYFAHCCLAKMHGGKMWSALWAVAAMPKDASAAQSFTRRRMVAAARERAAKLRSEQMSELWATGQFKRNRQYRAWTAEEKAAHSRRLSGRKSSPEAVAKRRATVLARSKRFTFIHADGRRFRGAAAEFVAAHGLSQSLVSCLCRGKIVTAKGWMLEGTNRRAAYGRDPTVWKFAHKDGQEFVGTPFEWRTAFGLDCGSVSKHLSGKLKTVNGWRALQTMSAPTG